MYRIRFVEGTVGQELKAETLKECGSLAHLQTQAFRLHTRTTCLGNGAAHSGLVPVAVGNRDKSLLIVGNENKMKERGGW